MSCDPYGIVFYGFPVKDVSEGGSVEIYDYNDIWKKERAPFAPEHPFEDGDRAWMAWRLSLEAWEKSPENIQVNYSGGESCEAPYLNCEGVAISVECDEQVVIPDLNLTDYTTAKIVTYMSQFCDQFGIEYQNPRWHLATKYF